jgi:hypothetical protein
MNAITYCRPVWCRASFIDASTASVPEFVRKVRVGTDIGAMSPMTSHVRP